MNTHLRTALFTLPLLLNTGCFGDLTGLADMDFGDMDLLPDLSWSGVPSGDFSPAPRVYFDEDATIETIAGSGNGGTEFTQFSGSEALCSNTGSIGGDGGPATEAHLNWPTGIAVDANGSLLIADQCNDVIRSVSPEGIINTQVSIGYFGTFPFRLNGPGGVEVSAYGNRYVVDTFSHTVLRIGNDGVARVIVGMPNQQGSVELTSPAPQLAPVLSYPTGVAEDGSGRLYIANYWGSDILKVEKGRIEQLDVNVSYAGGIATDREGNLYIVDNFHHQVLKRDAHGTYSVLAGSGEVGSQGDGGPAVEAQLHYPSGVRVRDDGVVFVTDTYNHRVVAITPDGILYTVVGNGTLLSNDNYEFGSFGGDGASLDEISLNQPYALDFDAEGNLLIADAMNNRIRKVRFSPAEAL